MFEQAEQIIIASDDDLCLSSDRGRQNDIVIGIAAYAGRQWNGGNEPDPPTINQV